ncbi:MAG: cytochrome P450 [Paludibaculum sp.]
MRRSLPFLGRIPDFRRDPVGFLQRMAEEQGDVARFRLGPQNVVLLRHPDDIRDVLVTYNQRFVKSRMLQRTRVLLGEGLLTSEEPFHTRQRKLVQPAFYRDRLVRYSATMAEKARAAGDRWSDGQTADLDQEMMRLTLSIVTATLFSANVEAEAAEIGAAMASILNMFNLLMLPMSEWLIRIPVLHSARRFRAARSRLDSVIYRIIGEHRAAQADQGDLLSMLMEVRDEAGNGMSDRELRDEALTLFIAGHETTAMALNWTWYQLARNPEVERRFHAELDTVLEGRLPGYDDFARLPVTESIFAESMRLLSSGLGDRPPGHRGAYSAGRRVPGGYHLRGESLGDTPACRSLAGSGTLRPGPLPGRGPRRSTEVRLLPLRRRPAGSASANASPGWRGCWRWRRSASAGGLNWIRLSRWSRCRCSRCGPNTA